MTIEAVLDLIDQAPAFAEPQPLSAEELRRAGLAALDQAIELLKAAEGDARTTVLQEVATEAGSIIGAGAVNEPFAKALLEHAAAGAGLIKAIGAKAVKSAIAAALKVGKKTPRDFSAHIMSQSRPGEAGNSAAVHILSSPSAADPAPPSASPFSSPSPAPPAAGGESASSQTGAAPDADAAWGAGGESPDAPEDEDALNRRLAFYPHTDLGNAERFRERWKGKLLWCPALGWLAWDGKRWSPDGADDLVKIAEHKTVRAIQDEAELVRESGRNDIDDPERGACDFVVEVKRDDTVVLFSDKIARWGRASEALNKLGALSKRGAPYFAIGIDKLDADKMKINVNNGTLSVARKSDGDYVSFLPHNPADLITKISPVDYLPAALCPEYDKFLARVQPSEDMRRWLHQWLGLSMTGDVSEQILAFLYGKGGNGKSVLIDAVSYVAGDYGETVPIETFLDHGKSRSAGQATPDLAILPGVRMLRTSEPEKNSKLAEAMVKLVTGGEPIQARHLNRDFFKFYPQFKLTISGNYRPTISGADEGIWRRLRLVPFDVTIPKEERDIHLADKLRSEASGILNRLLDGLRLWCDKRLIEPEDVAKATAEYRSDSDAFGRFAAMCLSAAPGERVQSSVLYAVYDAWCKSSVEKAWSARGLSMAMKERGYHSKQSNVMWWIDVKLIRDAGDFVDAQGHPRVMTGENDGNGGVEQAGDREF
ncbi:phage/plasmid primase, P4 family [Bradyrhizobium sp. JYMT SZCCT0428]|uniref:DNA primase family protein n=1 Tax=Bradyrhizobium sp. JYMT SZCCT0428 TaxID=2807673 RepID=UPI001BA563D8|nr:phage/plasmid primase, P4 family [Bradyrhizobium sp. JYMT SZCCT0428]MBR1150106.1 hypothetical protein [Bradyrhizobium sp. JYMT SZCCT0428]